MKKATAILLVLAMVLSFGTVAALAADGAAALPEPADGVITLTEDVTLTETAVITADTTLDLAGYTLTGVNGRALRVDSGKLTLIDSSADKTGKIVVPSADQAKAVIVNDGFVMQSGAIEVSGQDSCGIWAQGTGNAELAGGSVKAEGLGAMGAACSGNSATATFTMSGGSMYARGQGAIGIYLVGSGQKAVVSGGEITIIGYDEGVNPTAGNVSGYGIEAIEFGPTGHDITVTGGTISVSGRRTYAVYLEMDNKLTVSGGTLKSEHAPAVAFFQGGNTGTITGGVIEGKTYGVQIVNSATNALSISGDPVISGEGGSISAGGNRYKATPAVQISGGYFNGSVEGGVPSDKTDNFAIYDITGGYFTDEITNSALYNYALAKDYTPNTYTDEVKANETNILAAASEVKDGVTYNYTVQEKLFASGTGTEEDPYVIMTVSQLQKFAESVDNGTTYAGEFVMLGADLDLSAIENWNPIGIEGKSNNAANQAKCFDGDFNGASHTISGLTINGSYTGGFKDEANIGLFSFLGGDARVHDLNMKDVSITGTASSNGPIIRAGAIAGDTARVSGAQRTAVVDACTSTGKIVINGGSASYFGGGIMGRIFTYGAVINCASWVDVSVSAKGSYNAAYAGGIVGMTGNSSVVANCVAFGDTIATNESSTMRTGDSYAGGISGMLSSFSCNNYAVGNATIVRKDQGTNVGMIAGQASGSMVGDFNYYNSEAVLTIKDADGTVTNPETLGWQPENQINMDENWLKQPIGMKKAELSTQSFVDTLNEKLYFYQKNNPDDVKITLREWKLVDGVALPVGAVYVEPQPGYVLMNIPYDAFYAAQGVEGVDAVSSSTVKTYNQTMAAGSYHEGYDAASPISDAKILGVTYPVYVENLEDLAGLTEVTDESSATITVASGKSSTTTKEVTGADLLFASGSYAYYVLAEEPAVYMTATKSGDGFTFTGPNAEVEQASFDKAELTYGGHYTDLTLSVADAANITDSAKVNGIILTAGGEQYALRHVENVWKKTELGWYWEDLDGNGLAGKTITNIKYYINDGDTYRVVSYDVNILVKQHAEDIEAAFENSKTVAVTGLPADIQNPVAKVASKVGRGETPVVIAENAKVENGKIACADAAVCGTTYTVTVTSDNYADLSATVVKEHVITAVAAKAATCEEAGNTAYYVCSDCGKMFSDAEGTTEITEADVAIAALGHAWDEGKVTKQPTANSEGEKLYTCKNDPSHTKTETIAKLSKCDGGANCPSIKLKDVDRSATSWYHEAVDWAYVNGVTTGTTETTFSPNDPCTRAQAVTFLWRAKGEPAPKATSCDFVDVPKDAYYYKAVLWAVENGVTNGVDATHFDPDATCTRAHIVTFLFRAEKGQAGTQNPFVDVPAGQWFTEAVLWANANNITKGVDATHFAPNSDCIRAHIVTFLYRAYA